METEEKGLQGIIGFTPSGTAFEVTDIKRYEKEVGPLYFKHKNYASFRRQLSTYGFARVENSSAFFHRLFRRGRPELLPKILRLSELEEEQQAAMFPNRTGAAAVSRRRTTTGSSVGSADGSSAAGKRKRA